MPAANDSKAPPVTTLTPVFARLFDRDATLLEVRRLGAVKRDRRLHASAPILARRALPRLSVPAYALGTRCARSTDMANKGRYAVAWLLGIPLPILLVVYLVSRC